MSIFEYISYHDFLLDHFKKLGPRSGQRLKLSKYISVHPTLISQVLKKRTDFSIDQAEGVSDFLMLSDEETDYFLNLVIYSRASNLKLKKRYKEKIDKIRGKNIVSSQVYEKELIKESVQKKFYSSHIYGLLHVLSSLPSVNDIKDFSELTGHPFERVKSAITFLLEIGVLEKKGNSINPGKKHVHLPNQTDHIRAHHSNWRNFTMQNMQFSKPEDLHYSLVFSCSKSDLEKFKKEILKYVKSLHKTLKNSQEEKVGVFCFDLFDCY